MAAMLENTSEMKSVAGSSSNEKAIAYQAGFGGHFCSESIPGSLPLGQNSPQVCPFGLYAEQLSGTAFTAPRHKNLRTWLYRIRPSVCHVPFQPLPPHKMIGDFSGCTTNPNQMRWPPLSIPEEKVDFLDGITTYAGAGQPDLKNGIAIHYYVATVSMDHKAFCNADGDMLIVPQLGELMIMTEMGRIVVSPHEICVIQRGIRFSVDISTPSRGYILEIFKGHFELPSLGPIGSNGLANARDFLHPTAHYIDDESTYHVVHKFNGCMFSAEMTHSPFDVVAWHGNYAPFKYNLDLFNCMNSVTFDHPDPSIYTVLTCPSDEPGVSLADFVIFPPRWMVMEHTFRPPWYHRNCMSEFMGMIYGKYDARKGFVAGGASLHSCMTPHGPDAPTFVKASADELVPVKFDAGLAFMFETNFMLKLTRVALDNVDADYFKCWQDLPKQFHSI